MSRRGYPAQASVETGRPQLAAPISGETGTPARRSVFRVLFYYNKIRYSVKDLFL
jgi:hypothetical protein